MDFLNSVAIILVAFCGAVAGSALAIRLLLWIAIRVGCEVDGPRLEWLSKQNFTWPQTVLGGVVAGLARSVLICVMTADCVDSVFVLQKIAGGILGATGFGYLGMLLLRKVGWAGFGQFMGVIIGVSDAGYELADVVADTLGFSA